MLFLLHGCYMSNPPIRPVTKQEIKIFLAKINLEKAKDALRQARSEIEIQNVFGPKYTIYRENLRYCERNLSIAQMKYDKQNPIESLLKSARTPEERKSAQLKYEKLHPEEARLRKATKKLNRLLYEASNTLGLYDQIVKAEREETLARIACLEREELIKEKAKEYKDSLHAKKLLKQRDALILSKGDKKREPKPQEPSSSPTLPTTTPRSPSSRG